MKKSLYYVAIAIGFGISCALRSNGFIFHPVYAPPPIALESVQVAKNLNLLGGQKGKHLFRNSCHTIRYNKASSNDYSVDVTGCFGSYRQDSRKVQNRSRKMSRY